MPFLNNKYKATDPGKFNSVQDRQSFLEEFNKSYDEWQEQRNAANQEEEKRRPILDRIEDATSKSRLRKREREAARSKAYYTLLNSLKTRDDFDELSAMGQRKAANGLFDRTNMTGKSAEEQGVVKETRDDAFHQNIYDYMTPEQKSMYYAFLGLGDQQSAKRYLASIEEGLQKQAAEKLTETIQPGNIENVQDFADVTRLGVRSGIGRFETGVQQLVNPNAVSKNYTEMAFEEARKDMSGATGVVADLANTVGFMLLPAGGSMVLGLAGGAGLAGSAGVKALSASLFGAASGGSTYNDMLKENPGTDKFDAKVYSVINGALEGSLQYLLGGIGKLGVGGLSKVTGKTISGAVAKKLSNVAKASANTPAVKGLIKALVGGGKWAAGASDEALEEWLQAVLDPVMRNYVLGENNEVKLFGEDQLYAAFLGALGATVMNAPSNISDTVNAQQVLEDTVAKQEAKAAARANKGQPANAEAQAIPEATKEQIEAHMDNPDVKDLVIQINRLEAGIATGKSRHNDSPTGRKAQLAKAKKDLATLIAKLEQQQAPEQTPEQVPVDNAAGIPGPPPAPVSNNTQNQQVTDENIAEVLTEEPASADNRNGIDLVNKGLEMARGERGRGLVQEGMRNGTEGIISPPVDTTRPAGERQEPQPRGLPPAQQRTNNQQQQQANPRFLPSMPRLEDQQQPAEDIEAIRDIIDQGEQQGLSDVEINNRIREQLSRSAQEGSDTLSEIDARAERTSIIEIYRHDLQTLENQKKYLSPEDYENRVRQIEDTFRKDALAAGMAESQIQSEINVEKKASMAISEPEEAAGSRNDSLFGEYINNNADEEATLLEEGENGEGDADLSGDAAQRAIRPYDADDVRAVSEGRGDERGKRGQLTPDEFLENNFRRGGEDARSRRAVVKTLFDSGKAQEVSLLGVRGKVIEVKASDLSPEELSKPAWQAIKKAEADLVKGKYPPGTTLHYYVSNQSLTKDTNNKGQADAITYGHGAIWVNLSSVANLETVLLHERFHRWVRYDSQLLPYIRARLWEAGLSRRDLDWVVAGYVQNTWHITSPDKAFTGENYVRNIEEVLAEMVAGSRGPLDYDATQQTPYENLADTINTNFLDEKIGGFDKWQKTIIEAIDDFFQFKSNGLTEAIEAPIREAEGMGLFKGFTIPKSRSLNHRLRFDVQKNFPSLVARADYDTELMRSTAFFLNRNNGLLPENEVTEIKSTLSYWEDISKYISKNAGSSSDLQQALSDSTSAINDALRGVKAGTLTAENAYRVFQEESNRAAEAIRNSSEDVAGWLIDKGKAKTDSTYEEDEVSGAEEYQSESGETGGARPEGPVQGLPGPAVSRSNPSLPGEGDGGRRNSELARGILALQKQGKSFTDLGQSEGPEYFYNRIGEAKRTNPFGAFVTQHEIEEYDGMNLLTDSTGTVGVAVTEDGNIVSVFKDANSPVKGAMTSILFNALSNGGVKLDNFNSEALSYMYAQHGFIPVARTAFVDEFAPDDWNYERDGRPDIVFWVHNGDSLETIANNIGSYEEPDYDSLPIFDDYDQAEAYRDSLIAEKSDEDVTRYSFKRRNSTTKEENLDKLVPENREALEPLKNHEYKPESMDETTAKAWEWIEKHGGTNDDITEPYASLMNKKGEWKPTEMEAALVMFGSLAQNGDENSASALAAKIIGQAPDFGRVINYFKILQRYMPNAVSAISRSIADQIDVELTDEEKANIDLCDRIAKQGFISDSVKTAATPEFREWLEEASEYVDRGQLDATTAAYAAAMSLVTAKQPSTARQKFRALQRISLLSNPKTHFRNILGNVAEQAGSVMSRPGADLADRFISKFTNQRTFGSGGAEAFAKAVTDSVEKAVMDHALGINTVGNKFDEDTINRSGLQQLARQNAFDEKTHKALRNGISRVANNIDHLIGLGLSIGDAPFLIGTYEAALTQIMNANNATEATEEMMDTAWDVAFRRTFRDNNAVTKALTGIRNSLPFIGETIAPYVQTPVNVVLTAIQYSPIGVGEAFFKAFVDLGGSTSLRTQLKNNESTMKTQRQIAELVGRGALGTAAMLVGALLASAGRITGDDDDIDSQKEKNWNTATGRKGSSIKIGDTYIDPSSLQSLSTPIMAGAAAYEGKEEGDGTDWAGILGAAVKASMKMGNTMLEMPVLQGVADLFSGNYDNGELLAGALSLAGNAVTQVVPLGSLLKQAGKAVDPYSRVQSEINAGPGERVLKSTVNNLKTMLPGTRKTLSQRYDVLGNPIKNDASDNVAERLYNSFINPFNTSKENTNEVTDEIDRLYAALQDTDVLPSAAGNSISYGGEKYKFTSAEKQEYQRVEGESNAEILSSLVNSEAYDQLTDEEKAKVLSSIYDYSSNKAKADYLKKQGVEYESDAKWMDSIDSIVETGVDIGSAMVYRYEINQIDGADDQAYYIMDLPISADQKKALDTQFVDKFGFRPIKDDRDYTSKDALVLSMTSDKGRDKYNRIFSGQWTGSSGNTYPALTGEQFGDFYDAFYFKESPKAAESTESIKQMLMQKYGMDEDSAYIMAYDFRKIFASTKL